MKLRRPDNVVWSWPTKCFCLGIMWDHHRYGFYASCFGIYIGPLTLRWHKR